MPGLMDSPQFVDRINNPKDYPSISRGEDTATHRMSWGGGDGKFYAFPTVVLMPNGELKDFGENKREAYDYNRQNGNIMEFETAEEAESYADGSWKTPEFLQYYQNK